jgi:hypothetical protein
VDFFREFNWSKVALLYESGNDAGWANTAFQINTTLQASGFSVFSTFILSALGRYPLCITYTFLTHSQLE